MHFGTLHRNCLARPPGASRCVNESCIGGRMRVAMACPTIGQTRRGYERFMTELFQLMRADIDVTLFKGAGTTLSGEVVVRHVKRTGALARLAGRRLRYARYRLEFASFALALWPHLLRGKFDIVHIIDPPLARPLAVMRRWLPHPYRMVFTDGGPAPFDASPFADLVHCLTPAAERETRAVAPPGCRVAMLPVGVDARALSVPTDRATLRRQHGVAADTFVILSVTTLNRHHKRVDALIEEVARLPGKVLLWLDASVHPDGDVSLLALASARLGDRFRHSHFESGRIGDLYHIADVMVSASLHESFGMALVEAMCCGLPVLAHDSAHFRWLFGDSRNLIDMRADGTLAARLARLIDDRDDLRGLADPDKMLARFGWDALKPGYRALYRQVLEA